MPPPPAPTERERGTVLAALAVFVLAATLRLPFVGVGEGWFDEIYTVVLASEPLGTLWRSALTDQTNPPGGYLLFKLWGALGDGSVAWHRALSALCAAGAAAFTLLAARALGTSRVAAAVAAVIVAVSPQMWAMALEVRAYAPLALVAAVGAWVAARAARAAKGEAGTGSSLVPLALASAGLVCLHYFGAFTVVGLALAAGLAPAALGGRARMLRVLGVGAPAALLLIGWLALVVASSADGSVGAHADWIAPVSTLGALGSVPTLLIGALGYPAGRALAIAVVVAAIAMVGRAARGPSAAAHPARLALVTGVLPVLAAVLVTQLSGRDVWVGRYLTGLLPGLALVLAVALDAMAAPARRVVAIAVGAWALVSGAHSVTLRSADPDWSAIIPALARGRDPVLCVDRMFVGLPLLYHTHAVGRADVRVLPAERCAPGPGLTWLVSRGDARAEPLPPPPEGTRYGPRVVLFRGTQDLDARRVIRR
jgi:uncharacterized membrane protein